MSVNIDKIINEQLELCEVGIAWPVFDDKGNKYKMGKPVKVENMKVGERYVGTYKNNGYNLELFEFTGFSDISKKYGESGPVFKSYAEVKKAFNTKTLKDLENIGDKQGLEYGHNVYLCGITYFSDSTRTRFIEKLEGCYLYLFKSRWSRGSGADRMSFFEAIPDKD